VNSMNTNVRIAGGVVVRPSHKGRTRTRTRTRSHR